MAHHFAATVSWTGGRTGSGALATEGLTASVTVPASMGGPGTGTNPEALLVSSAATCYAITLAGLCERMRLPLLGLELASQAVVEPGPPLRVASIVHRPRLAVPAGTDRERLLRACRLAEEHCLISAAIRGQVQVTVEPEITMA